jgi:hypothetical protein
MDAIADAVNIIPRLTVRTNETGQIITPYAWVGVPTIENYRESFAGARMTLEFPLTILTSAAYDEIGTRQLVEYVAVRGPSSIYEVFESNPTLSGTVERARVSDFRPIGADEYGAIGYFGGVFTIHVMARG